MIIRPIEIGDVATCRSIVAEHWGKDTARRFAAEVSQVWAMDVEYRPQYFVAVDRNGVLGFAGMIKSWIHNKVWDFCWVNVRKDCQGLGIGAQLTQRRIDEIRLQDGAAIHVMTTSPGFFAKFGFLVMCEYAGEGWCLMALQLGPVTL
jgi:predicted N-acetyltransferase YhbS